MALFKISKGNATDLPAKENSWGNGYAWFTQDDGKFYIDYYNGPETDNPLDDSKKIRQPLNAYKADRDANGNIITSTYLPLTGGTMTGALNFSGANSRDLTWNDATYQQRIHTVDDSQSNTNVFVFQQSSDAGSTWADLMSIKDNGQININSIISGAGTNKYLSIDDSGIQAYDNNNNNNEPSLYLNHDGGAVNIGSTNTSNATRDFYGKFDFKSSNGFTYSGIGEGGTNSSRPVWFSYDGEVGRPVYNNNFQYNPSLNKLSTGNLQLTGELDVIGNAYLHNQTMIDSLTAGSLIVTGIISGQLNHKITIGNYEYDGSADITIPIYNGATS